MRAPKPDGTQFQSVKAVAGSVSPQTLEMTMTNFQLEQEQRHTDLDAAHQEIDQLRDALRTRPVIDQAKGILMAQHGCSPDEAFELLGEASQRYNRKLRDLAADIVASVQRQGAQRTA